MDRCFLGILSSKEQKFVNETIFAEPMDLMKSAPTSHAARQDDVQTNGADANRPAANNAMHGTPPHGKTKGMGKGAPLTGYPPRVLSQMNHAAHGLTPSFSSSSARYGVPEKKQTPTALSAALDRLTASLHSDGTLPLSTFEMIVKELSGIECLQTMLLFRPNKKKGKGGRQPAKDPRLDPNMDPRKAKRIVANRKSAARSKQKQKRHVESLQLQHDTLMIQMLLCGREKEKLDNEIDELDHDTRLLEKELQALIEHVQRVQSYVSALTHERDSLRSKLEAMSHNSSNP